MIYNNVAEYILMKPAHFRFLKSVNFTRVVSRDGCGRFDVELVISKISGEKLENLQLRCTGVFDININDIESVSGLQIEIEDVSRRQIEGASFKVLEVEEGAFSFYCEEFFAELLK